MPSALKAAALAVTFALTVFVSASAAACPNGCAGKETAGQASACGQHAKDAAKPEGACAGHAAVMAAKDAAKPEGACAGHAAVAANPLAKAPGEASVGDLTTCPVSGETFKVEANSAVVKHQGKSYFLCCQQCVEQFAANPGRFLKKS